MKVSILCSDRTHPINRWLSIFKSRMENDHNIEIVQAKSELTGGDVLFLISCYEIVGENTRSKYQSTLVVHASNLPEGRGWSPHIWQILEGRKQITVTLLEAEDKVDTGAIWKQLIMDLEGHELYDEINEKLFDKEIELMEFALANFKSVLPVAQNQQIEQTYRKRTPADSRIDPTLTLSKQFDLIRIADPDRYPAFFDFRDHRYIVRLTKIEK